LLVAAAAIAEPLLEEHGVADGTYGFCIAIPKWQNQWPLHYRIWF
jgi:hypothetical protein